MRKDKRGEGRGGGGTCGRKSSQRVKIKGGGKKNKRCWRREEKAEKAKEGNKGGGKERGERKYGRRGRKRGEEKGARGGEEE